MTIYDKIREARDGATTGGWVAHPNDMGGAGRDAYVVVEDGFQTVARVLCYTHRLNDMPYEANARLIALAPTMADMLLAQQKKLEAADRLAYHAENLLNNPGDSHHHDGVALALAEYRASA